jgi:hypothetical protein
MEPKTLLDTDVLSGVMRMTPTAVNRARTYLPDHRQFTISLVTRFEILRGLKAKRATAQLAAFDAFCGPNAYTYGLWGPESKTERVRLIRMSPLTIPPEIRDLPVPDRMALVEQIWDSIAEDQAEFQLTNAQKADWIGAWHAVSQRALVAQTGTM